MIMDIIKVMIIIGVMAGVTENMTIGIDNWYLHQVFYPDAFKPSSILEAILIATI